MVQHGPYSRHIARHRRSRPRFARRSAAYSEYPALLTTTRGPGVRRRARGAARHPARRARDIYIYNIYILHQVVALASGGCSGQFGYLQTGRLRARSIGASHTISGAPRGSVGRAARAGRVGAPGRVPAAAGCSGRDATGRGAPRQDHAGSVSALMGRGDRRLAQ